MPRLTERLEIRLPPETLRLLEEEANWRGISVAQLVREAITLMLQHNREARRQAARALFAIGASVPDWLQMEREITEARARPD